MKSDAVFQTWLRSFVSATGMVEVTLSLQPIQPGRPKVILPELLSDCMPFLLARLPKHAIIDNARRLEQRKRFIL